MEIICDSCQSKLKVPDEKIPAGKSASFACPKCKEKITIAPGDENRAETAEFENLGFDEESLNEEESADTARPFQFIEEEGETALVCETDPVIRKRVADVLTLMEYHVTTAPDARAALKKIRYQKYNVIVVNERFGTDDPDANGILIYLERLPMGIRRNMFVTMISDRFRTMDHMAAFNRSVNLIINKENAPELDKILSKGITDYDMFYRIYKETLQ